MKARDFMPAVKYGAKWYPEDLAGVFSMNDTNKYWFVDGDKSANGSGTSWEDAFYDVESAANNTSLTAGDTIFVAARTMSATSTDPVSYTENAVLDTPSVSLIGVSRGRTQGGLPQLKVGSTTTSPVIDVKAPGCLIANIGINGVSATGGGVRLYDDGGSTAAAFGTSIVGCHFKNCVVTANDGRTGGAIYTTAGGGPWQLYIGGNRFYKNEADIVSVGTSGSIPQDWVIEHNEFSGPAANVDVNIYTSSDGVNGLVIRDNTFSAMPALSAGQVKRFVSLTGSVGILYNNAFATNDGTFKVAGSGGIVPATMFMAGNYQESTDAVGTFGSLTGRST
jgi:hypothetical protein